MKKPTIEEFVERGVAAQKTVDTAIAAAAAREIPPRERFVALGPKVVRNGKLIAGAVSNTFARRIANALNVYKPDKRGL